MWERTSIETLFQLRMFMQLGCIPQILQRSTTAISSLTLRRKRKGADLESLQIAMLRTKALGETCHNLADIIDRTRTPHMSQQIKLKLNRRGSGEALHSILILSIWRNIRGADLAEQHTWTTIPIQNQRLLVSPAISFHRPVIQEESSLRVEQINTQHNGTTLNRLTETLADHAVVQHTGAQAEILS